METTELGSAPSLPSLYARAALGALPLPGGADGLPERELVLCDVKLDPEHVAAYSRVCGLRLRDSAPGTFPHVLAFPLQLKLMTERSFPFSVLGMVHIANRIEVLGALPVGSSLDVRLRAADLRPHRRGRQFDLVSEAELGDEPVWKARSTYLNRERTGADSEGAKEVDADERGAELATTAMWKVPGDVGRRYAGVSGDRNPIHMHPLGARAFGFPSMIAHGMWTKARCLASFEGRLPDAYAIEAEFKAPLRIPGKARFLSEPTGDGYAFAVESPDGEHTHAAGSISRLADHIR